VSFSVESPNDQLNFFGFVGIFECPLLADSVEKVGFSADLNSGTTIA
jgi:hypothetical protein